MASEAGQDVTTLLASIRAGNEEAKSKLVALVYQELRRIAGPMMRNERADHTLQATALVHESLLRLLKGEALRGAHNRGYFFGAAAQAMRQVLVDHARSRATAKRGGGRMRVPLDDMLETLEQRSMDVLALDEALTELEKIDARKHQIVSLRFFGGLAIKEIAELMDVSVGTVENDLRIARGWLRGVLESDR